MNPELDSHKTGKIGELLVQIKLLQNDIKISEPILDSGNDFIAIKGNREQSIFKSIQVKTRKNDTFEKLNELKFYDILALVRIYDNDENSAKIYLLSRTEVNGESSLSAGDLMEYEFSPSRLNSLFE